MRFKVGDWFVNKRFNSESEWIWQVVKIDNSIWYKTFHLPTQKYWNDGEIKQAITNLDSVIILDEETKSRLL